MYDVFIKEKTDGAEENFERETAFSQASHRRNSLVFCFNVMEQREYCLLHGLLN